MVSVSPSAQSSNDPTSGNKATDNSRLLTFANSLAAPVKHSDLAVLLPTTAAILGWSNAYP